MRGLRATLIVSVMLLSVIAGCLYGSDGKEPKSPIDLVVHYDSTSGAIQDVWNNGQQTSSTGVTIEFDFARTTSEGGDITLISLDPGDGTSPITSDPSENAQITYEWMTHGLYSVILSATDSNENVAKTSIIVRVDHHILWSQDNTNNPTKQEFSLNSDSENMPEEIIISSTVENVESNPIFGSATPVDVSWSLRDGAGEVAESCNDEQIGDGQSHTCEMTERTISDGQWSLEIELSNDENVDIDNDITIAYVQDESAPNPLTT